MRRGHIGKKKTQKETKAPNREGKRTVIQREKTTGLRRGLKKTPGDQLSAYFETKKGKNSEKRSR